MSSIIIPMFTVIILIMGIVVCATRLKFNSIYKYGLCFFSIRAFVIMLDLIVHRIIVPIILRNISMRHGIAWMFTLLNLPSALLSWAGYIILIIGFYKVYNANAMNEK